MKRDIKFLLALTPLIVGLAAPDSARAQTLSRQHQRIDFLAGQWRTESRRPDGTVTAGNLEYRWVLGGAWMRVEFVGEPADGSVWEAHAMMRYDPDVNEYVSYVFAAPGNPVRYRGHFATDETYRVERETDEGLAGIDYRPTTSGIYQENWIVPRGQARRVTLRTTYVARE